MEFTFDSYIKDKINDTEAKKFPFQLFGSNNPKLNSAESKFESVAKREENKFNYIIMRDGTDYYVHIKVPSEVVPKFYYDVVLLFDMKDGSNFKSVASRPLKVFSNDPYFCYTFGFALDHHNLIIPILKHKIGDTFLKQAAKVRNPNNKISYIKSLYFAYIIMNKEGLFSPSILKQKAISFDKSKLLQSIEQAITKIQKRQEEGKRIPKQRIEDAEPKSKISKFATNVVSSVTKINTVKTTSKTKKIKKHK